MMSKFYQKPGAWTPIQHLGFILSSLISKRALFGLALAMLSFSQVFAQFHFGQNKVQYTDFRWRVMTTERFKIYYYEEEEYLAEVAARLAEESYTALAQKFNHEIFSPIPLIIYSSPLYFSQTNTTSGMISEATGGFTEFLKGRVVVPFTGSYHDFAHVIRHELVHVFTLSKLARVQKGQRTIRRSLPPLWFIEGLAEHWSTDWDSQGEMLVRDMVISGQILGIESFYRVYGSFMMYKLGQSVCDFIESEYGTDKLTMIFENWWKSEKFSEVVYLTLGETLAEVSRKWKYSLKKRYFPLISEGDLPKHDGRQLTFDGYSVKSAPIIFDDGEGGGEKEWIVYKSDKLGYSSIYMMDGQGEKKKVFALLRGERSSDFESLHLLRSGIDATNEGQVAFSAKTRETDALYIFDLHERRVSDQFMIDGIVSILSPRFSPDGSQVVFSGVEISGAADIYILKLSNGSLRRLTEDFYNDFDPVYTSDGQSIIFASDRGPWGETGATDLYTLDLLSLDIKELTATRYHNRSPEPTADGIYFSSDRDGVSNIYHRDSLGAVTQVTRALTGVFDPRTTDSSSDLIYTAYQDYRFHIFRRESADTTRETLVDEFSSPQALSVTGAWRPGTLAASSIRSSVKYDTDYSIDIAQTAVSYDPVFGTLGGVQLMMSDMLGDHIYYGFLSNSARAKDDILTSFNVGVSYLNRKGRVNWGGGVFHLYDEFYNAFDGNYFERQVGGYAQLRYPLSRFDRLEATFYARYRDKDQFLLRTRRRSFLVSQFVSFVSDNSLWEVTGPIDGHRVNLTVGVTEALDEGKINDVLALIDLRRYQRLGRHSALATRVFAFHSGGVDPRRIYHGGSWSFRGFSRREWYVPHVIFISNELRFPLINHLVVGLPIGNLGFSSIRGALFYDTGAAWEKDYQGFIGSFGAGMRVGLGRVIAFRFDWSYTHDYQTIAPGPDFDFFFGWNF